MNKPTVIPLKVAHLRTSSTRTTCPYCGVGCGVIIETEDDQITGVRGDPDHPANAGRLCTKGSTLHLTAAPHLQTEARLLHPQQRLERGAELVRLGWDAALEVASTRFADVIKRHGPDAVGFYVSGQLLTEDYYVFNKIAKGLIGTNNIDTNSRLCMSSAVAGYKATLGADAPPACYDDLNHAHTVFIAGANTAWAHPILFRRLEDARRANPSMKLIVADPRRTETAQAADLHLPLLPGTDVALFHGLLHVLLWEGLSDPAFIRSHTVGFEALRDRVREFTPRHVAAVCGLAEDDIVQAARWFGGHTPTLSLYCQGLNQSHRGTDKNAALINLHLATGQIGKPGAGPFSLTGQPNAMGGREVGGLANLLSAHRDLANPGHRAEVAALWGVPEVPAAPGLSAMEMFQAAADGAVKALWIACTNPAQSLPDQAMVRRALARCEFVVVQEAYAHTATTACADLVLPATTWGEKEGTVTNSERLITRVRAAVPAPGQARHDWAIGVAFAHALGPKLSAQRPSAATLFPYETPEAVWNEHRESTRGRDLDITGLSYEVLNEAPQRWPYPAGASQGQLRLYTDGQFPTADGRARFVAPAYEPVAEPRDARYPVSLNTGRLRDQWHGMSRTGTLGRLFGHASEPCIEMHPQELARRRWNEGDLVRVQSRRGAMIVPVQSSDSVAPAQAFIAMHWGEEFVSGRGPDGVLLRGVNALCTGASCPSSKQPELKHAAVQVERVNLPWRLVAAAWFPPDRWQTAQQRFRAHFGDFAFATCVPFGREPEGEVGVLFRAAALDVVPAAVLNDIENTLGLDHPHALRYNDPRRGQRRAMHLSAPEGAPTEAATLASFLLAGDTAAQSWVLALLKDRQPARSLGRALLAGTSTAPIGTVARGAQVCSCFDVRAPDIAASLSRCTGTPEERLTQLQGELRCGTQCGSCLPTLRKMVRDVAIL